MIDVALVDLLCTVIDHPMRRFDVTHHIGQTMRHGLIFKIGLSATNSIAGVIQRFFVGPFRHTEH